MAAYTVTPAEVSVSDPTQAVPVIGDEAIDIGEAVYRKTSNGRYALASAVGTAEQAQFAGIAVSACAAAGQPFLLWKDGEITLDTGTLANAATADIVVLGATAGALYPSADLASTNRVTICGYIKDHDTPAVMVVKPTITGTQLA